MKTILLILMVTMVFAQEKKDTLMVIRTEYLETKAWFWKAEIDSVNRGLKERAAPIKIEYKELTPKK